MGEDEIMKIKLPEGTTKCIHSFPKLHNQLLRPDSQPNEMTHKDLNREEKTCIFNYRGDFDKFKDKLRHFPDYSIVQKVYRRSLWGSFVPSQRNKSRDQLIAVSLKEFWRQAKRWDIQKKEANGMFYGFKAFEYLLHGKEFVIQTDNANLAWIGANQTPIVAR
jgi:hypothetical protein